ncbi:hypothetical protein EIP86_010210 [Pleurotus ostreatoroseus]|nr:hypothetical protein EIP86_010210 [Pleurotus ostreatoroseus]
MTTSVHPSHLSVILFLLLSCIASVYAIPTNVHNDEGLHALSRRGAVVAYDSFGNVKNVTDATTGLPIAQGAATDGGGTDFDASAIIWLALSFVSGVPLMLGGLALPRMTTGMGIALTATVCIWAAFVSTINASGVSDLIITLISLGSFVLGFGLGVFEVGYYAGMTLIALLGGFSVGVRIVLFRADLLIHKFFANWLVIVGLGLLMFLLMLVQQRATMARRLAVCSTAVGTFMTGLGIDLIVNKQSGMSMGLRYLFDRNSSHLEYIASHGWHPGVASLIIMAVSLALISPVAYAQHRIFKSPFKRVRTSSISTLASLTSSRPPSGEVPPMTQQAPLERARLERKRISQREVLTPDSSDESSSRLDKPVDLNSTRETLTTPTPNPSIHSTAMLLPPQKLPK